MSVCRVCRTEIPNGEEYCKKCLEKNKMRLDESYLDGLLEAINYNQNRVIQPSKMVSLDVDSDITNIKINNKFKNNTKQDERILRKEFDKENELNIGTDDDILSLLQDNPDDNGNDDGIESYFDEEDSIGMEDTDEDLLALLDMISAQDEASTGKSDILDTDKTEEADIDYIQDDQLEDISQENDLLSIDDISPDMELIPDIKMAPEVDVSSEVELSPDMDLSSDISDSFEDLLPQEDDLSPSDVGDIFSDVLSALDTLSDKDEPALDEFSLNGNDIKKKETSQTEGKEEKGLLKKLLGKKDKKENTSDKSDNALAKESTSEDNNEKKAKKAKKKAKPKKKKEKVNVTSASSENTEEEITENKKKAKEKKQAKKASKPKPVKKVKEKPEVQDDPEDNIKVNRVAVIFVMTFFMLVGGFVILGTELYSYSLGIENASTEFSRGRYEEAYNHIYGLDIREKDQEIYDKIMTVMYVKKELKSFENYKDLNMYPEALDSLLKGLRRYDTYINQAKELGIKTDLDSIKDQILEELKNEFSITEEEAVNLNNSQERTQYSINVVNMVLEKKN